MDLTKVYRPQPAERWVMYRLVCPVVDAACAITGIDPFFEYSMPNGPNKRLSADIALIPANRSTPVWMIEAKKFERHIDPGMVDSYLVSGAMGVVTNGNQWIFKIAGKYLGIGPLLRPDSQVDETVYRRLVALIATVDEGSALALSDEWTDTWTARAKVAAPKIFKASGGKGTRAYHEMIRYETLQEAAAAARVHAPSGTLAADLLDQIIAAGQQAPVGWIEVNKARMVWWLKAGRRGARLNLTGHQVEMLVDNAILDRIGRQSVKASIKMHDKNIAMSMLKAGQADELSGLVSVFSINPLRS